MTSAEVTTTGNKLNVIMGEALALSSEHLPTAVVNAFSVTADGNAVEISGITTPITKTKLNFTFPSGTTIRQGQTVKLSYNKTTAGTDALKDDADNEVVSFTDFAVTNSSTVVPSGPGAPTGLGATANGPSQIDLAWMAPADVGGSAITGYKVEWSADRRHALDRARREP